MNSATDRLKIVLHEDKTAFAPRETIRGVIEWNMDATPRRFDLSLFWYTDGRGTRDVGMVHTLRVDDPEARGSKDFSFALPEGPFSVSGKLVSVIWAIELTCSPTEETVRREIIVSPAGKAIVLGSVAPRNPFAASRDLPNPDSPESILRAG
jgi:hypothetical protein